MIELILAATLFAADHHATGENAHAEGDPWCDQLDAGQPHADCTLQTAGDPAFILTFAFSPSGDRREIMNTTVRQFDGTLAQTMSYATESFFYPSLADLNGDGMEELLVPIMTGNVNTTYSLAIGTEYGFEWTSYELNGYGVDPVEGGLFMVPARDSAISRYVEFYRMDGTAIENIATLELSYDGVENADDGPNCRLVNGGEDQGEAHYCGLAMLQ
jgi:hypothetical protein